MSNNQMVCKSCPEAAADIDMQDLVAKLEASYADRIGVNLAETYNLPGQAEVERLIDRLLEVIFPGFSSSPRHRESLNAETTVLLVELKEELLSQISRAMRFGCSSGCCGECEWTQRGSAAVKALFAALPDIRALMKFDVQAAYDGDPAAVSLDEIILSYPCIKAITIQSFAHVLYQYGTPLIPRLMTEYAHSATGIDIHPGAKLGRGVFIDHGTGVVIGETAVIGDFVRIYQGVTLGALSFPTDAHGVAIKGCKRHPTVGNHVTIYAGATILGDITIGENCVIGGNVWLTEDLPAGTRIIALPPEQQKKQRSGKPRT